MSEAVDDKEFWKKRIEKAESKGIINHSVYLVNPAAWKQIEWGHMKTIRSLIKPSDKVLDAGCGYGRLSAYIQNYTGIDFSGDFIERANRMFPGRNFVIGDLREMPFEDGEFDWAVCISIRDMIRRYLTYDDWDEMEKELKRVAKKTLILEYTDINGYTVL
jgi:ubiquinone/menaquinone biosynthesis C-methylase UbiE